MIIAVGLRDINPQTSEISADSVLRNEHNLGHKFNRPIGGIKFAPARGTNTMRTQDTSEFDLALEHGANDTMSISLSELAQPSGKAQEPRNEEQV
jgi:hypothetical protein